ncbi:site-specific integrase (plasmid) [Novosphingobium sp. BL-8A]|uniref:tyrosine-type recombinase/integrase n=1 Tax=Novosphingobium sp. BL-8A TaxID=3127639 RepID=UPI0037583C51
MPWTVYNGYGQRKYLTSSEIDAFMSSARKRSVEVQTFCCMIALTGCRISEALEMTRECIDFETKHVIIRCLKKRGKQIFRAIPLPAPFLAHLRNWFGSDPGAAQLLWPWSRMTGYRRVCEVMECAGIRGAYASPKGLRHGFGVRAIQSGVPLTLVQRWLGHADIKTTAIYTTAMGPEEREIASRMWRHRPVDRNDFKVADIRQEEPCQQIGGNEARDYFTGPGEERITDSETTSNLVAADENDKVSLPRPTGRGIEITVKSIARRLSACLMIHYWLKCRTFYRYKSKTYCPPDGGVPKRGRLTERSLFEPVQQHPVVESEGQSTSKRREIAVRGRAATSRPPERDAVRWKAFFLPSRA